MKKLFLPLSLFSVFAFGDGYPIANGSTGPITVLMISNSDHITACTGATVTIALSKNGGAFTNTTNSASSIGNGWYQVTPTSTETNTNGPLDIHATAATCDPSDKELYVVAFNPQDAVRLGLTAIPNVASGSAGALLTSGTGTGQLSVTSGVAAANTTQLAGQTVTAAAGVTFPTSVASPTNITAGTMTTCTNVTNAPTAGDLTATMKTSVTTAATAATPTAASCSALGTAAAATVTNAVAPVQAKTDQLTFTVSGQVDANTKSMNNHAVLGTGAAGDTWRGH